MKTEVRHDESWLVTVRREEDSEWPDQILVNPLSTRWMKPETVSFVIFSGKDYPEKIEVFGTEIGGTALKHSRFHHTRVPEWLATVIEDARQYNRLTPYDTQGPPMVEAALLRRLVMKWMSKSRHPMRIGDEYERERELLEKCASDVEELLHAAREAGN